MSAAVSGNAKSEESHRDRLRTFNNAKIGIKNHVPWTVDLFEDQELAAVTVKSQLLIKSQNLQHLLLITK
jgi:hypothetical protein